MRQEAAECGSWPRAFMGVLAAMLVTLASGCATRACPRHFRAPVLSGVAAPELPGRGAHTSVGACVAEDERELAGSHAQYSDAAHGTGAHATVTTEALPGTEVTALLVVVAKQSGAEVARWSGPMRWRDLLPAAAFAWRSASGWQWDEPWAEILRIGVPGPDAEGGMLVSVWASRAGADEIHVGLTLHPGPSEPGASTGGQGTHGQGTGASNTSASGAQAGQASASAGSRASTAAQASGGHNGLANGSGNVGNGAGAGRSGTAANGTGTAASGTRSGVAGGSANPSWTRTQGTSTAAVGGRTPSAHGKAGGSAGGMRGGTGHLPGLGWWKGMIDAPEAVAAAIGMAVIISDADIAGFARRHFGNVVVGALRRPLRDELADEAEHIIQRQMASVRSTLNADPAYRALPADQRQAVLAQAEHGIEQRYYEHAQNYFARNAASYEKEAADAAIGVDEYNRQLARQNARAYRELEQAAAENGGTTVAKAGAKATGQVHHAISRAIWRQLRDHKVLRGVYRVRDSRLVTRAADAASHRGYQTWHRELDEEVVEWLQKRPQATQTEFEAYLRSVYRRPELRKRFPGGLP